MKKEKLYKTDIAAVGDFVEFEKNSDGTGVITEIFPRTNYISRKAPKIKGSGFRGERLEQIIAANIDNFILVTSVGNPPFNNKVVDRLLVTAESSHLHVIILVNKIDLEHQDSEWFKLYRKIGYEVIETSAENGKGMNELNSLLKEKKNLLWGQSGVGKSSILNYLFPDLDLNVGRLSNYDMKGSHTTVTSVMLNVSENTFVIDTPGIREIDPYGIKKEFLSHYFLEFSPYINECRFNTCIHQHEPGCAIIEAVESEEITIERYESYLRILNTIEEDLHFK